MRLTPRGSNGDDARSRFHELVWPHRATVLRTATFLTRDAAAADDLAQETMLKAFKALDSFREGTDARAWLMSILRNARIDRLRSAAARKSDVSLEDLVEDPADAGNAEPDVAWENPQQILEAFSDRDVIQALRRLPEEIRWTLLLLDVEGMDHRDVAGILGVPAGTIKSRAHRGRAMLREALLPLARERRLVTDP